MTATLFAAIAGCGSYRGGARGPVQGAQNIGRVDATRTIEPIPGAGSSLVVRQPDAALEIPPPMLEITVAIPGDR